MLKNVKIKTKLIFGFIIVSLIAGVIGFVGYDGMSGVMESQDDMSGKFVPSLNCISAIMESQAVILSQEMALNVRSINSIDERNGFYRSISDAWSRTEKMRKVYESIQKNDIEKKLWNEYETLLDSWKVIDNNLIEFAKKKDELIVKGMELNSP